MADGWSGARDCGASLSLAAGAGDWWDTTTNLLCCVKWLVTLVFAGVGADPAASSQLVTRSSRWSGSRPDLNFHAALGGKRFHEMGRALRRRALRRVAADRAESAGVQRRARLPDRPLSGTT